MMLVAVERMLAWVGEGGCREGEEGDSLEHHVVCMVGVVLAETVNVSLRYEDLVERWSVYSR
jgi:hypothetical protein